MRFLLDIGTHYAEGLSELNHKLGLSYGWTIHCFEPNPLTRSEAGIEAVTKTWQSAVFLHKKAVWNETGKVKFLCSKRDAGELADYYTSRWPTSYSSEMTRNNDLLDGVSSHISGIRQNSWGGEEFEIDSISGHDILQFLDLKKDDEVYIKIDAEGAEKEIIESFLSSSHANLIKSIFCEVHEGISTSKVSIGTLQSMCSNKGIDFHSWW